MKRKHLSAHPVKVEVQWTAAWRIFKLLRWLGMKDIAFALFKDVVIYHVYRDGRLVRTARLKAKDLTTAAAVLHRLSRPIPEVPEVPRTATPAELRP